MGRVHGAGEGPERELSGRTAGRRRGPRLPQGWQEIRQDWAILTAYQRFEALIALLLRTVIGAVILVALYRLVVSVAQALVLRSFNPLDHAVFQQVFGEILTLLIALEFNHTLHYVGRERGIIQARVVILIALLALARKVILLDPYEFQPASVAALGGLTLALGVTYWLVGERDSRPRRARASREP